MASRDKYNFPKSVRLTKDQSDYLDKNNLNLRDVLVYYIDNHNDKQTRLRTREKYLLNHIDELEKDLIRSKDELKQVKIGLGKVPTEDKETLEIVNARDIVLERVKLKYGKNFNKSNIMDFLSSKECDRVLKPVTDGYSISDVESFKTKILESIKL